MPAIVLIGAQWGDEGKGKVVDWLTDHAQGVVRFQGGHNAGHTLVIDGVTYKLSLLPSGVVRGGTLSVIGNGVVIDLEVLFQELDGLDARGVDTSKLLISANAHLIPPYNRTLDKVTERFLGSRKIGTTGRGISGGERARLSIARAIASGRPVILLDEPVAHLDHAHAGRQLLDGGQLLGLGRHVAQRLA